MKIQALYEELYSDPAAYAAYSALTAAGGHVYIVGGAVRDCIIGKKPNDIDLMVTDLDQSEIEEVLKQLPGHATFAGKNFGVYHYHHGKSQVEIALPRLEQSTGTGHKDFEVKADKNISIEEDLGRRDFTANAIAFDIDAGVLVDPFDGETDINSRKLRLINAQAFKDDPLRIVRALVAYAVHGLEPDDFTLDEMAQNADRIRHLPGERVQMELDKLLSGQDPANAFRLAYETGVLDYILPELAVAYEFDQRNIHHDLLLGDHILAVLDHISTLTDDPDLRLAALLHDIGKPDSFWLDEEGHGHFYEHEDHPDSADHEDLGAEMAAQLMRRLHYPNNRINRVKSLVQHHMFPYVESEKAARKFLNKLNGDAQMAEDLHHLREADASGKSTREIDLQENEILARSRDYVRQAVEQSQAATVKDLAVDGHDLMTLGVAAGPPLGVMLKQLLDVVLEQPELNEKELLLQYVKDNLL